MTDGSDFPPSPFNWIGRLPDAVRQELMQASQVYGAPQGGDAYTPATNPRGVYRVLSGEARMYLISDGGKMLLLKVFQPGESFGEVATLDLQPYPVFVTFSKGAGCAFISHTRIQRLYERHPALNTALQSAVCYYVRILLDFHLMATTAPLIDQLRFRLNWLASNMPASGKAGSIRVTQQDLADMLGCTRQSVNEALTDLEAEHFLTRERGQIILAGAAQPGRQAPCAVET